MAIHCAAAEHGGLIKNKEKKIKFWVKLKSFPTNVWWLENHVQCSFLSSIVVSDFPVNQHHRQLSRISDAVFNNRSISVHVRSREGRK